MEIDSKICYTIKIRGKKQKRSALRPRIKGVSANVGITPAHEFFASRRESAVERKRNGALTAG